MTAVFSRQIVRLIHLRPFLRLFAMTALLAITCPDIARAADGDSLVYKKAGERDLHLYLEKPADGKKAGKSPAIVFYFGGGWVKGSPDQFKPQSDYFASRGVVGIRVEYRVIPQGDDGPPTICIQDAKSAMRYVRAHAEELGIDPDRIAAAGGSAGGHLAAATALLQGLDDPKDDTTISPRPNALVLFNPVFDNGPGEWGNKRVGARFEEFSPAHHVSASAPPTIVFLGEEDKLIPVKTVQRFAGRMKESGARCETHFYPGAGHGFFNKNAKGEKHFRETVIAADQFLVSLGWLQGAPTLSN